MVLVVLAIAGSLLGLCADRTSRRALEAGIAARALQRRWGVRTLETACLAQAETILREGRREDEPPPAVVRLQMVLGGMTFDLVVADELAKANVNRIAAGRGTDAVRAGVAALSEGRWVLQVLPRPVEVPTDEVRTPKTLFVSLEQVFSAVSPAELLGAGAGIDIDAPAPGDLLTCWGNGKIHLRRAPPSVLREALKGVFTEYEVHRLVTLRDEAPEAGLGTLLSRLELDEKVRSEAEKWITETSTCHSLWVVARGRTRNWHRLSVRQQGDAENDAGNWTFEW